MLGAQHGASLLDFREVPVQIFVERMSLPAESGGLVASGSGRNLTKQSSLRKQNRKPRKSVRFSQGVDKEEASRIEEADSSGHENADQQSSFGGFIGLPACRALKEFFWVVESILSVKGGRRNSPKEKEIWQGYFPRLAHPNMADAEARKV